jgi:glycosyltransferase involved in cell wall biosynthesis
MDSRGVRLKYYLENSRKWALVTSYPLNTGIGTYALHLYEVGFFKNFIFFKTSYGGNESKFTYVLNSRNRTLGLIRKAASAFSKRNIYNKYLSKFEFIHFSDPDFFHLAKHNNAVGTIHDLFFFNKETKDDYSLLQRKYYKIEMSHAESLKGLLTISYQSKKMIKELYPNLDPTVIHLWTDDSFVRRDKLNCRRILHLPLDKFIILNIGNDYKRKNIDVLPKIMNHLSADYLLIRIGNSERIVSRFIKNNFINETMVDAHTYPYFLNAADVVIIPSLEEGFGIPLIEAINSGTPLVVSNIDIFKEILGTYKYYADPSDVDEWVQKIQEIKEKSANNDFVSKLYRKISDYYRAERARKQYVDFYKKIGFL